MTDINLYEESQRLRGSDQAVSRVSQLIAEYADIDGELKAIADMEKALKERRNELTHRTLPEAMLDAGVRDFTTPEGLKAKIAPMTDGSLGQEDREKKLQAIIDAGGGEIVKQMVIVSFPKEQFQNAEATKDRINQFIENQGWKGIAVTCERNVHHMTLTSWVKERQSSGDVEDHLPDSFFEVTGLWFGEGVKVTIPKKKAD